MTHHFSADERYEDEIPFQLYWCIVNFTLTGIITVYVIMGSGFLNGPLSLGQLGTWDFGLWDFMKFEKIFIVQNSVAFYSTITTIFISSITSLVLFFIMKKYNVAEVEEEEHELALSDVESQHVDPAVT